MKYLAATWYVKANTLQKTLNPHLNSKAYQLIMNLIKELNYKLEIVSTENFYL